MKEIKIDAYGILQRVREEKPLVHHLTNWVTIYDCANIVKVIGGSPVMAHAREEAAQMAGLASSVVLNIGTLTIELVEAMKLAAGAANKKGIPVLLDACGVGATSMRYQKSLELMGEARIDIVKGNASEIANLSGAMIRTKGVDSGDVFADRFFLAKELSVKRNCTVVMTGGEDIVAGKDKAYLISNGTSLMSGIVGTGCMSSSVVATFAAVEPDLALASAAGLVCFEIAAELAAKETKGPGSFKEKLFDRIFNLDKKTIDKMQRVQG